MKLLEELFPPQTRSRRNTLEWLEQLRTVMNDEQMRELLECIEAELAETSQEAEQLAYERFLEERRTQFR
jgi:hypothetical protein